MNRPFGRLAGRPPVPDSRLMAMASRTSVIKEPSEPCHRKFGCSPDLILGRERKSGKVGNRRPSSHVLRVAKKLLEAEAFVWSPSRHRRIGPLQGSDGWPAPSKTCRGVRTSSNHVPIRIDRTIAPVSAPDRLRAGQLSTVAERHFCHTEESPNRSARSRSRGVLVADPAF
jgi:hypothetical protein